jgi:1-phosphatidylinositol-3-phosphate 5-kinase
MREQQPQAARDRRTYSLASSEPLVEVHKDEHEAVRERESLDKGSRTGTPERLSLDTTSLAQNSFPETADTTVTEGRGRYSGEGGCLGVEL